MYYSEERAAYAVLLEGLPEPYVKDVYRMEERAFRGTFDKVTHKPFKVKLHAIPPEVGEIIAEIKEPPHAQRHYTLKELEEEGVNKIVGTEIRDNGFGVLEEVVIIESPEAKEFPDLDF